MKMTFHSHANKTHFHKKGGTLGLLLKVRVLGTQKWPIEKLFIIRLIWFEGEVNAICLKNKLCVNKIIDFIFFISNQVKTSERTDFNNENS